MQSLKTAPRASVGPFTSYYFLDEGILEIELVPVYAYIASAFALALLLSFILRAMPYDGSRSVLESFFTWVFAFSASALATSITASIRRRRIETRFTARAFNLKSSRLIPWAKVTAYKSRRWR